MVILIKVYFEINVGNGMEGMYGTAQMSKNCLYQDVVHCYNNEIMKTVRSNLQQFVDEYDFIPNSFSMLSNCF